MVLEAFKNGADGVMISGCHIGDCHYSTGNYRTLVRYHALESAMTVMGLHPDRLKLLWASASEGQRWADGITEMTETVRRLGPSPLVKTAKKTAKTREATPKITKKKAGSKKATKKGGAKK